MTSDPAQFYTGLISELYEPLVGEKARADQYRSFIDRSGQPVLEPFCGSGSPMLELLAMGYDIDGLDASQDMLDRLQAAGALKGISATTYCQQIQDMDLPRLYRTIFVAGASMLKTAGFSRISCVDREGKSAQPDASLFIFLAQKL